MINNEIPFPYTFSVILSPNHIAKMVPVTIIKTELNNGKKLKKSLLNASPGKVFF